jgi:hypothetical protein
LIDPKPRLSIIFASHLLQTNPRTFWNCVSIVKASTLWETLLTITQ